MKYIMIVGLVIGICAVISIELSRSRQLPIPVARISSLAAISDSMGSDLSRDSEWNPTTDVAIRDGGFFDVVSKLSGRIPEGWMLLRQTRRGDTGTSLLFAMSSHPGAALTLYYDLSEKALPFDPLRAAESLRAAVREKTEQRVAAGLEGYRINPDMATYDLQTNPAISWTAEFSRDGKPWREHLTRVHGRNFSMLFFLMAPASDMTDAHPGYVKLISSTKFY